VLDEPLRQQALKVARFVARRMEDPNVIYRLSLQASKQSTEPILWFAPSLSSGVSGVALLHGFLAPLYPEHGQHAERLLQYAATSTREAPIQVPGLFSGTSSLMATLLLLSNGGRRYQKTLASMRKLLYEQIDRQKQWRRNAEMVTEHDYDVISGAAGILTYLIMDRSTDELTGKMITRLLDYLTWLTEPGQTLGDERWYIAPEALVVSGLRAIHPQGYFNCGLAHGLPGPLAALSLTWLAGYRYPGLREAIASAADWLIQHQIGDEWGSNWPIVIPVESSDSPAAWGKLPGARAGWCYGAPGVARSLWLAGHALDDERVCRVAIESMEAVVRRPLAQRFLFSPTLCHGYAGLLQICLRFAHECDNTSIRDHIPVLVQQILDCFDADLPLGFQDIERPGTAVDQPSWLVGAPGVAMALLAAATEIPPVWDRLLLIS